MMLFFIILLSVLTSVLGYTTYNLLRKNEALEDVILEQEELISDITERIDSSMSRMKEIDRIGSFEADDETGFVFKNMYEIISELEQYYGSEEKE
jgi:hypothetical protein